jgi:hypothetical protein
VAARVTALLGTIIVIKMKETSSISHDQATILEFKKRRTALSLYL